MDKVLFLFCLAATALAVPNPYPHITAGGCGLSNGRAPNPFIVGGAQVNPRYKWPWIGSLRRTGSHICGGSLVKSKDGVYYFITAAHCVDGSSVSVLSVKFGAHFRLDSTSDNYKVILNVKEIIMHNQYNRNTFQNDIAVLTLQNQETIVESDYIRPICFADQDHTPDEQCTVIGWGTLSEGGSVSGTLQEVTKPILADSKCSSDLGSNSYYADSMLCSGLDNGGVDACQGDSGGPFFCERNGVWELVGVVSWGYGCARPGKPGVYADCWNLRDWVNNQIN
ncbi:hypothetical protein SNE40_005551 [Patella caerulea]|uniref:Peptidase S1 domain-containing protein n=1 Tax=Patella caerulea TaxID=87958 RepID=A0AAN8K8E8_PATCE